MNDFFKTLMGRKLFESDIPDLIKALHSLSKELKTLNEREEKKFKLDERLKRLQIKEHLNKVNENTK
jgi:hypothetical protein